MNTELPSTAPRSEGIGTVNYVECPAYLDPVDYSRRPTLFLAGGIKDSPDWQSEMVGKLQGENFNILNPRRKDFPSGDPQAGKAQMRWELRYLESTLTYLIFWFDKRSLAPIAIGEYFRYMENRHAVFVGVDPEYTRREDIEFRLTEWRPSVEIAYTLEDLAQQVRDWFRPVDVDSPITALKGWSRRTAVQINEWSTEQRVVTIRDWLELLYANHQPLWSRIDGKIFGEVSHRLSNDMGIFWTWAWSRKYNS